jgi:nucleotide-binding universal stress UspA family protein
MARTSVKPNLSEDAAKRRTMSTIVIGFDGGRESCDALRLGSELAHSMGAELIVAAASPPDQFSSSEAQRFVEIFDRARQELPHRDFAMRELRGVAPAAGLKDLASREEADLVVVGSTHRGKLGRVVPGSVVERLLSGSPCPVAVAPRDYARGEHFGLGLVGVAFDGSPESELALRYAAQLATRLHAKLRVITIVADVGRTDDSTLDAVVDDRAHEVNEHALAELPPWLTAETALEPGDPARALARHGVDLDLLVIGSRGYGPLRRTLLGGVSADVMRTAPCPVLAVPRTAPVPDGEPAAELAHPDSAG